MNAIEKALCGFVLCSRLALWCYVPTSATIAVSQPIRVACGFKTRFPTLGEIETVIKPNDAHRLIDTMSGRSSAVVEDVVRAIDGKTFLVRAVPSRGSRGQVDFWLGTAIELRGDIVPGDIEAARALLAKRKPPTGKGTEPDRRL